MDLERLGKQFNRDYYEDGIRKHISGYEDYHFMPTRSFPEAVSIRDGLRQEGITFNTVVDYGCAKGFLVYALTMLEFDARGVDISQYAIENCLPQVKERVCLLDQNLTTTVQPVDLVIAKDVLEHVPEEDMPDVLADFKRVANHVLIVVPLGDGDRFRVREYEVDTTHRTRKDEAWWINKVHDAGFRLKRFDYKLGAVKEKWLGEYPYGNGFLILENTTPIKK